LRVPTARDCPPTPVATTLTVVEEVGTTAVDETVSVSVDVIKSGVPVGVTGVALQLAVTPAGKPVTVRAAVAAGAKEPPAVTVITSVPLMPCITESVELAAVTASVGALSVTCNGIATVTEDATELTSMAAKVKDSEVLLAMAALLPARVRVVLPAPAPLMVSAVNVMLLKVPVMPVGKDDGTVAVTPLGTYPPTGVMVITSVTPVWAEFMRIGLTEVVTRICGE